jgi:hypothetical protein
LRWRKSARVIERPRTPLLGFSVNTGNLPTTSVDYATKYALKTLLTADGLLARIVAVVMFAAAFAVQQQGPPSVPVTTAPPTRCCPLDGILVPRRPHPVKVLPRSASMGARRLQYRRGGEETGARPALRLGRQALQKPGSPARAGRILRTRCDPCAGSMTTGSTNIGGTFAGQTIEQTGTVTRHGEPD